MTSHYDFALFLHRTDKGTILLFLYVDDMIIIGDNLSGIQEFKDFLSQQFEMKDLGHLSYFLGLEITHSTDGLYITQAKYTSELLSQARLTNSKTIDTVVELNAHLTPLRGKPLSNPSLYRRLVSQYLSAPRSTHYAAVLRILRYLKGSLFYGLFYSAQSPLILRAFSDIDWAGNPTDRSEVEEENAITEELSEWQDGASEVIGECGDEFEKKIGRLVSVIKRADDLRLKTVQKVVELLTPQQAVEFLIGAAELQFGIRGWGINHDRRRTNF
ncbi:uncharacterized mitochondrial protein AtMg00810-like [Quercus suber]|uniref:uncharacterized mitochondrial protein AtMg00810-like n=1 Tax=Quercus suber TaxID=58331 RepID=UPI0032DFA276